MLFPLLNSGLQEALALYASTLPDGTFSILVSGVSRNVQPYSTGGVVGLHITSCSSEHPKNAEDPISVTPAGILIEVNNEQP